MKKVILSIMAAATVASFLAVSQERDRAFAKEDVPKECRDGTAKASVDKSVGKSAGLSDLVISKCAYCHSIKCLVTHKGTVSNWPKLVKTQLKKSGGPDVSSSERKAIQKELKKWAK